MKNFILITLSCVVFNVWGQSKVFNQLYFYAGDTNTRSGDFPPYYLNTYNSHWVRAMKEVKEDVYFATGLSFSSLNWSSQTYTTPFRSFDYNIKIDANGNQLDSTIVNTNENTHFTHIEQKNASEFYSLGFKTNTGSYASAYWALIDTALNVIEDKTLDFGSKSAITSALKINNNLSLLLCNITITGKTEHKILKMNALNTIIDTFSFSHPAKDWKSIDLCAYNQSNYFSLSQLDSNTVILQKNNINTGVEWQKNYQIAPYLSVVDILFAQDSHIYIVGNKEDNLGSHITKEPKSSFVLKIDTLGNLIWQKKYDKTTALYAENLVGIKESTDGNFILAGSFRNDASVYTKGQLMKIDTAGGIIWERELTRDIINYSLYNDYIGTMLLSADGGIVIGGMSNLVSVKANPTPAVYRQDDMWILKTDSCGFAPYSTPAPYFEIDSIRNKTVYLKHLSSNYCTAYLHFGENTNDSINIYAYNKSAISHYTYTYQDTGKYIIRVNTLAGDQFRAYSHTIHIKGDTSLGIQHLDNYQQLTISPNPTKNKLQIEFLGKKQFDYYSIYNELGKSIKKHQALANEIKKQSIDISYLTNGIYTIHFYDAEQRYLVTRKIVVLK